MSDTIKLFGYRAAARHVGCSHEIIKRWVKRGLKHEIITVGNTRVTAFDPLELDTFAASMSHSRGRPPKRQS